MAYKTWPYVKNAEKVLLRTLHYKVLTPVAEHLADVLCNGIGAIVFTESKTGDSNQLVRNTSTFLVRLALIGSPWVAYGERSPAVVLALSAVSLALIACEIPLTASYTYLLDGQRQLQPNADVFASILPLNTLWHGSHFVPGLLRAHHDPSFLVAAPPSHSHVIDQLSQVQAEPPTSPFGERTK